jgi:hypothetical protein
MYLANHEHDAAPRHRSPAYVTTFGRKVATVTAHLYLNDMFWQSKMGLSRRLPHSHSACVNESLSCILLLSVT